MYKFLKETALCIVICTSTLLQGQPHNDQELQNRYWTYRENQRKHLTSIGWKEGQGFAFSDIKIHMAIQNVKVNSLGADIPNQGVQLQGRLNVGGDVTA